MKQELALIPEPKNFSQDGGTLALKDDFKVWHTDETALEAERIREFLAEQLDLRLSLAPLEMEGFQIGLSAKKPNMGELTRRMDEDGYSLLISRRDLVLHGGSSVGVYWGAQTLRQMFDVSHRLSVGRIVDQPAMPWRGVHFDLSGATPTFATLVTLLDQMAQYKLNVAMVEYQGKFPFVRNPKLKSHGAFTESQLQRILDFAGDRHLEIIPLVQTLGRAEFILRNEEFRHLGENDSVHQLCPSNPEVIELVKGMIDDVLAAHPNCRFLHLGGEQAFEANPCSECGKKARKKGRILPYIKYLSELCQYVQEKGVRPLLWTDLFWQSTDPFAIRNIPRETILVDRNYHAISDRTPFVWWGPEGIRFSRHGIEKTESIPDAPAKWFDGLKEAELSFLEKYWKPNSDWDEGEAFPLVQFCLDEGFEVVGAPAIKGVDGKEIFVPDYLKRLKNLKAWSKVADENSLLGAVASARSRESNFSPPSEPIISLNYSLMAAADAFWRGTAFDTEDFQRRFGLNQYNDTEERTGRGIRLLSNDRHSASLHRTTLAQEMFTKVREDAIREKKFLDYLVLACELRVWHRRLDEVLTFSEGRVFLADKGKVCKDELKERLETIKTMLKEISSFRRRIRNVLKGQMASEDIREITESQLSGWDFRAQGLLEHLSELM